MLQRGQILAAALESMIKITCTWSRLRAHCLAALGSGGEIHARTSLAKSICPRERGGSRGGRPAGRAGRHGSGLPRSDGGCLPTRPGAAGAGQGARAAETKTRMRELLIGDPADPMYVLHSHCRTNACQLGRLRPDGRRGGARSPAMVQSSSQVAMSPHFRAQQLL
jgi:hypothetical protein